MGVGLLNDTTPIDLVGIFEPFASLREAIQVNPDGTSTPEKSTDLPLRACEDNDFGDGRKFHGYCIDYQNFGKEILPK